MTQESEQRQAFWKRLDENDYLALTPEEQKRELMKIQALIDEDGPTPKQKADLFLAQALLYRFTEENAKAIASYDKALELKPDDRKAWYNRGIPLGNLDRLEEAIASGDKA
ncbi:tetratricopeptide repeat protein [Microcoleus sp. herbarium14]|uniref:tetratricopeptide repeat protein n=1 Tax=Microcoleus sp. herbarium14 TaxID=3055439 RepID=UPI002FD65AB8